MTAGELNAESRRITRDATASYRRQARRRAGIVALLALVVAATLIVDLTTGPAPMGLARMAGGLIDPASLSRAEAVILFDVRLPTSMLAILVGAALGVAGAEMQTVLNNPLASPFTLGVAAAATLGAAIAIAFGLTLPGAAGDLAIGGVAFVFAIAAMLAIQILARIFRGDPTTLVLFGIALYFGFNACEWLVHLVSSADASQRIVFWSMGSFARANWLNITIVAFALAIALPFALRQAWALTVLRGGEDHAASLGIAVGRIRFWSLLRVGLLTAAAVAFVGEIGFVGLVGPHIARLLLGEDHRFFLPGSALAGALLMGLASVAAKALVPGMILPVGIVTALIGIPLFVTLIAGRRRSL